MSAESLSNARFAATAAALSTLALVLADTKDDVAWVLETINAAKAMVPPTDLTTLQSLRDQAELFQPIHEAARALTPIVEGLRTATRIG